MIPSNFEQLGVSLRAYAVSWIENLPGRKKRTLVFVHDDRGAFLTCILIPAEAWRN